FIVFPSHEVSTPCCHSNALFLSTRRNRISWVVTAPVGGTIPCSVTKERSELVTTAGKKDSRMNVARPGSSMEDGSPCPGNPMNGRVAVKWETPDPARAAFCQSGNDRGVENGTG